MPAAKKDPSVRARRNKTSTRATLTTAGSREIPPMPTSTAWKPQTEAWWDDVWSSPMAPEWDESDVHNVILCALLYNDIWCAETARDRKEAAAEYRLQRKDLGLTPYDRRRLEWTIEQADDAKDRGRQRRERVRSQTAITPATDPRSVLRAVT